MKNCLCVFLLLFVVACAGKPQTLPSRHLKERDYQEAWCGRAGGRAEVRLPDATRCDCLTATHAIEFDFAPKWAEAVTQALHYGLQTGKRPGIVLIMLNKKDRKYLERINRIIEHYHLPVDVWEMNDIEQGP